MREVGKVFGGVTAVDQVSFVVEEGAIKALIGPNGAGKTTILNLITGFYQPTSGQMYFMGRGITGEPTHRLARRGLSRTFQNVRLFENMTVHYHRVGTAQVPTSRRNRPAGAPTWG